jgi:lipopolysaccharide assembly outer membrane protein LptD (OstA)
LLDAEDAAPLPFWTKLFSRTHLKRGPPMKLVLSIVMVAAFAVLAAAQVTAPPVEVRARVGHVLDSDVVRLRGDVIVKVNGVEIRADEMEGTKAGREFTLRGNVRVMLPAPLSPGRIDRR